MNNSTNKVLLIDVREEHEHIHYNIGGLNIPLSLIDRNFVSIAEQFNFNNAGSIVLYCKSGFRSAKASTIIKQHQIQNVFSLKGGLDLVGKSVNDD